MRLSTLRMSFHVCLLLTCLCILFPFPTTIDGTNTLLIILSQNHHLTSPHLTSPHSLVYMPPPTVFDCLRLSSPSHFRISPALLGPTLRTNRSTRVNAIPYHSPPRRYKHLTGRISHLTGPIEHHLTGPTMLT